MQARLAVSTSPAWWLAPQDGHHGHDGHVGHVGKQPDLAPGSDGFKGLMAAFRASGGIARADDLARLLCDRGDGGQGDPILDDLLTRAEVFSFMWRGKVWLPMFQFDLRRLSVQRAPQRVRAELLGASALDGWDCAAWFARPNAGLNQRTPVDLLLTDLPGVLDAARADRWVSNG